MRRVHFWLLAALSSGAAAQHAQGTQPVQPLRAYPPLPLQLSRPILEPATRDPFTPVVSAAPAAPALPVRAHQELPALPPTPPPVDLVFAGRMTAPDGRQVIIATQGDNVMPLSAGLILPNGYRVHAITEHAVELSYPPLNTTARMELPTPPRHETR